MKFKRLITFFLLACALCFTACDNSEKSTAESVLITQESVTTNVFTESKYQQFTDCAVAKYLIPGLKQKFIPQGMDVWAEKNLLLISGYFKSTEDAPSSMILTVDLTSGNLVAKYCLKNLDGSFYTGHAGGLTVTDKRVYISSEGCLYGIYVNKIKNGSHDITIDEVIKVPTRGAFCNYSGGYLWVGDFYYDSPKYQTPSWRHMESPSGEYFFAWLVGYRLNQNGLIDNNTELDYNVPNAIISVVPELQGATFVGDRLILSRSNGRAYDSDILIYQNPLNSNPDDTLTVLGQQVPHWYLTSEKRTNKIVNMPMSQAIVKNGDKFLLLYESAASEYKDYGGKNPTDSVWEVTL